MKIQTSKLTDYALDWAVALAKKQADDAYLQALVKLREHDAGRRLLVPADCTHKVSRPSTDWADGGPIIEHEDISVLRTFVDAKPIGWIAEIGHGPSYFQMAASTLLVAGLRCLVARELGDEVEIPDELLKEAA